MTYQEIKECSDCPLKIDGFCKGIKEEEIPMCASWSPDTNVSEIVLDLLLKDM